MSMKNGDDIIYAATCLDCDTCKQFHRWIYEKDDDVLVDEAGSGKETYEKCKTCGGTAKHIATLTPDGCLRGRDEERR